MEGSGKQLILNRCSLVLIPFGSQLFLQSRWTRVIRFLMRVWVICLLPSYLQKLEGPMDDRWSNGIPD